MFPALVPLRYRESDRSVDVASCMGSHSSTIEVCVALRSLRTGVVGACKPYALSIWDCRDSNAACDFCSAA